jgi:ligand-binding sensor domain-containing protein
MTNHYIHKPIYFLLLGSIFLTSCNGQKQIDFVNTATIIPSEHPKMIRTQGTDYTQVGCGFQDKAGNLWFGTVNEGVYRYDGNSFTQFTKKDGLNDNCVNVIIQDRAGNILFGTSVGICKYDGKTFAAFTDNKVLNNNSINSLLEDKDGNIWFGTMNNGVYRYDGKSLANFLNKDYTFHRKIHAQLIMDILQDQNGNIWFSSWNGGGVWRYDPAVARITGVDSFTNFSPSADYYSLNEDERSFNHSNTDYLTNMPNLMVDYVPKDYIHDDMIFSISEDKAGNIWFATRRHGACRYDGKSFSGFRENEGFVSYGISSILEDKKGNFWFATGKNGVWSYDGKTFKNFTEKDGLVNNSVWFVIEDKRGNLWFGTRGFGLSCYDGKTFTTFSQYEN